VDRLPIYLGEGDWGLACPDCGQIDSLLWLPEAARHTAILEAVRRHDAIEAALGRAA
jgi:hypothetical protein